MSDPAKRRVRTSGGEVAVLQAGDPEDPAVLLLAGGFGSSHLWRNLVPLLAPWMHVLAPDLPGSGDSDAAHGADLSLEGHARSMRDLLEHLGVDRFAVVGHGHGGGVAQRLALGGGADAIVLIDSIAFDAWPAASIRELRDGGSELDRDGVETWLRGMLDRGMSHPERLAEPDRDAYLRPFAGPDGAARFSRILASFDGLGLVGIEPALSRLDVPALVVWGEDDAILPAELAERLGDALPMATVALLPGCGHFVLEDAPETAVPLVFQWLRSRYLKMEHRHDEGPVVVTLGRPPGEERR